MLIILIAGDLYMVYLIYMCEVAALRTGGP
jgi:hypothetical protein